jgi:UDP-N-acetylglucosamine:LPS N-acetylglucosamine transferase
MSRLWQRQRLCPIAATMQTSMQHRVLAIASGGGHWIQLARLADAFAGCDTLYVTTVEGETAPTGDRPVSIISDCSRNHPWRLLLAASQLTVLMMRFRPRAVVTTGAAPGYIALRLAKLCGCRTVWLDSIANADQVSMSARLARRYADAWLTQWEEVSQKTPGLEYWGRVL